MKDQNEILKKGMEKPSLDFSKNLMNQIIKEEMSLSRAIQKHGELNPSVKFTDNIMGQLEGLATKQAYQPVISKRSWFGVTAVFTTIFGLMAITKQSGTFTLPISLKDVNFNFVDRFESNAIFIYVIYGVLILSLALLAEQKFLIKKSS